MLLRRERPGISNGTSRQKRTTRGRCADARRWPDVELARRRSAASACSGRPATVASPSRHWPTRRRYSSTGFRRRHRRSSRLRRATSCASASRCSSSAPQRPLLLPASPLARLRPGCPRHRAVSFSLASTMRCWRGKCRPPRATAGTLRRCCGRRPRSARFAGWRRSMRRSPGSSWMRFRPAESQLWGAQRRTAGRSIRVERAGGGCRAVVHRDRLSRARRARTNGARHRSRRSTGYRCAAHGVRPCRQAVCGRRPRPERSSTRGTCACSW